MTPKRRILAGLVIGMSLLALFNPVAAAGRHARRGYGGERDIPGDAAPGPRIDDRRHTGNFSSSSERFYTGDQVNALPFRSPAEALEIVPGLAVGR